MPPASQGAITAGGTAPALDPALRQELLARLRRFYERELSEGQSAYFTHRDGELHPTRMGRHWLAEHRALFARLLALGPQDRFLDVGCAEGYYTLDLAARAGPTVAVDMAMSVLRFMGGLHGMRRGRLHRLMSDVERLPFGSAAFDKALCSHLLEHVLDDRAVIREIHRVLRPGGTAVFAIPLKYTLQYRCMRTVEGWARRLLRPGKQPYPVAPVGELDLRLVGVQAHVRHYSVEALRERLEEARFVVTETLGVWFHDPRNWLVRATQPNPVAYRLGTSLSKRWPELGAGLVMRALRP
jgi:ubiquinone/menaquinone biosynthesis C-methylase UbiE